MSADGAAGETVLEGSCDRQGYERHTHDEPQRELYV